MQNGGYTPGHSCLGKRHPSGCRADAFHLVGSQFKVENIVVLGDMGGIGRAWNGNGAALQMPAEDDLIDLLLGLGCGEVECSNAYDWHVVAAV